MASPSPTDGTLANAIYELTKAASVATVGVVDARERAPDVIRGWFTGDVDALKVQLCGAVLRAHSTPELFHVPFQAPVHSMSEGLKVKLIPWAGGATPTAQGTTMATAAVGHSDPAT